MCVNCEDKIKNFKIKNLNSDHFAYDTECPCLRREYEKQKRKIDNSLQQRIGDDKRKNVFMCLNAQGFLKHKDELENVIKDELENVKLET